MGVFDGQELAPAQVPLPPMPTPGGGTPAAPAAPEAPTLDHATVKNVLLPQLNQKAAAAEREFWTAFNSAQASGADVSITGGKVVRNVTGKDYDLAADGTKIPKSLPQTDSTLNSLYIKMQQAKGEAERTADDLKNGIYGVANTVGKNLEATKSDEVQRRFESFLQHAKAVYGLEDAEQNYGMDAQQANIEGAAAVKKGLLAPGAQTIWNETRPSPLYSMMTRDATPVGPILPDYNPGGTGVPGEGEYEPSYGAEYGIGNYSGIIGGYANGTLDPADGVDEEVAWMLKMPDIPFDLSLPPVPVPASWMKGRTA